MSRANKRWFRKKFIFQKSNGLGRPVFQRNMFSSRKNNKWIIGLICGIAFVCVAVACGLFFLKQKEREIVKIQVEDMEIYQDDAMPEFKIGVTCENEQKAYQSFIDDLNAGVGYTLQSVEDSSQEGEYEIQFKWNPDIEKKLAEEWKDKITCKIETGTLTVRNKFGEWEGDKFKKRDETYAANEFIVSKGQDYYFDQEGNKVTGEYVINGYTYYFTEEGAFDTEKNKYHPNRPMIALTFDDGPGSYTEELLNLLEENGARATFFVLGQQVEKYPDAVKKMKEIGCQIGNHTYSHKRLTELSEKDMLSQINKTNKAVKEIIGENTKLVRPTYGAVNSSVRKYVKYPLIMWSLDTEDWQLKDATKIKEAVLTQVEDGDIVLMHDIHDFTVEAMKEVIPELVNRGYQLVTVSELAEVKGVTMEKGEKYFEF